MENTLQNKAKFFAQYYGQKVARSPLLNQKIPANKCFPELALKAENKFYLELKSVSYITEEDAAEVFMLTQKGSRKDYFKSKPISRLAYLFKENHIYALSSNQVDRLRSKEYALPYDGLSVEHQIEYGWIKLKP